MSRIELNNRIAQKLLKDGKKMRPMSVWHSTRELEDHCRNTSIVQLEKEASKLSKNLLGGRKIFNSSQSQKILIDKPYRFNDSPDRDNLTKNIQNIQSPEHKPETQINSPQAQPHEIKTENPKCSEKKLQLSLDDDYDLCCGMKRSKPYLKHTPDVKHKEIAQAKEPEKEAKQINENDAHVGVEIKNKVNEKNIILMNNEKVEKIKTSEHTRNEIPKPGQKYVFGSKTVNSVLSKYESIRGIPKESRNVEKKRPAPSSSLGELYEIKEIKEKPKSGNSKKKTDDPKKKHEIVRFRKLKKSASAKSVIAEEMIPKKKQECFVTNTEMKKLFPEDFSTSKESKRLNKTRDIQKEKVSRNVRAEMFPSFKKEKSKNSIRLTKQWVQKDPYGCVGFLRASLYTPFGIKEEKIPNNPYENKYQVKKKIKRSNSSASTDLTEHKSTIRADLLLKSYFELL